MMNSQTHQTQAARQAIDPICGMNVAPAEALQDSYEGVAYYFCSKHCAEKFRSNPNLYIQDESQQQESGGCCQASKEAVTKPTQENGGCCQ